MEGWTRAHSTPQSLVLRCKIVLAAAEGKANSEIAREFDVSRPTILLWRKRFEKGGAQALTEIEPGRGRPRVIDGSAVKRIVEATTQTKPKAATHWSCRTLAKTQGVSPATVQRIWDANGLKPHRTKTFKLSND